MLSRLCRNVHVTTVHNRVVLATRAMVLLFAAGCVAHTPPSAMTRHRTPEAMPEGTIMIGLVIGLQPGILVDSSYGIQLRVEYQATPELSVGASLAGGTGIEMRTKPGWPKEATNRRLWMLAARLFGQWNAGDAEWAATTFGLGFGGMNTGLRYLTLDAGESIGYINEHAVPHVAALFGVSIPIAPGQPFGDTPKLPETEIFYGGALGLVVPIGDHAASIEAGLLKTTDGDGVLSLSLGDSVTADE